jgi:hypothetical protein
MPTDPGAVSQPKHPLHALTTFELRDHRRDLERAIAFWDTKHPVPPLRDTLRAKLDAVIAEQASWPPMRDQPRRPVGQLTTRELDRYGSQLARCLKALGTDAPIRAEVQRELATVRAEQDHRARPGVDA